MSFGVPGKEESQKRERDGSGILSTRFVVSKSYLALSCFRSLSELITKRGTLEILIPLCCTTDPIRYIKFRNSLRGFNSKTLAIRLKQLERNEILERRAYKEIPPRVEYRLTNKGQELAESVVDLL
jgi:DNA-binding HxlR family transcriptional regulator